MVLPCSLHDGLIHPIKNFNFLHSRINSLGVQNSCLSFYLRFLREIPPANPKPDNNSQTPAGNGTGAYL